MLIGLEGVLERRGVGMLGCESRDREAFRDLAYGQKVFVVSSNLVSLGSRFSQDPVHTAVHIWV
jgi:hypothetical protein